MPLSSHVLMWVAAGSLLRHKNRHILRASFSLEAEMTKRHLILPFVFAAALTLVNNAPTAAQTREGMQGDGAMAPSPCMPSRVWAAVGALFTSVSAAAKTNGKMRCLFVISASKLKDARSICLFLWRSKLPAATHIKTWLDSGIVRHDTSGHCLGSCGIGMRDTLNPSYLQKR